MPKPPRRGNYPANIHAFLAEIRARRRWSLNAGFAIAPDTNIGSGSEERTIYIPVFGHPLMGTSGVAAGHVDAFL